MIKNALKKLYMWLHFLGWTAKVSYRVSSYEKNGFYMDYKLRARWYSPVFWIWGLLQLLGSLFHSGLIDGLASVYSEAANWTLGSNFSGTWKEGISKRQKRKTLFVIIWGL